jgi:hypothetical protein
MPYRGRFDHAVIWLLRQPAGRCGLAVRRKATGMSVGKTAGWTVGALLLGVLAGFAGELLRRQPAAKIQQRYVAPEATRTTEAATPQPVPEPAGR